MKKMFYIFLDKPPGEQHMNLHFTFSIREIRKINKQTINKQTIN